MSYEKLSQFDAQALKNSYLSDFENYVNKLRVQGETKLFYGLSDERYLYIGSNCLEEFLSLEKKYKREILRKMYDNLYEQETKNFQICTIIEFLKATKDLKYVTYANILQNIHNHNLLSENLYVNKGLMVCNHNVSFDLKTTNKEYLQIQKNNKKYSKQTFNKIKKFNGLQAFYDNYYDFYHNLEHFLKSKGKECFLKYDYYMTHISEWVYENQYEFIDFLKENIKLDIKEENEVYHFSRKSR